MAKAHRGTPDRTTSDRPAGAKKADGTGREAPSNELAVALLEQAAHQLGVDEASTILALTEREVAPTSGGKYDFAEDDGKYDFAEDNDRVEQQEALPGLRPKHAGKEYKDIDNSAAFVKGAKDEHAIDPNDVAQGALGDCYLMAGMIAVARANPDAIAELIKDNEDGTFDVSLYIRSSYYSRPTRVTKTVDARIPMNGYSALYAKTGDKADGKTEMWAALLEKTVAQHKGSYDLISGGNIAKGFEFHGATELLTGKNEGYMRTAGMQEDDVLLEVAIALEEQKPVTCDSLNMEGDAALAADAKKFNVYGNHAYVPESVDLDGRTLTLTNPWGSHHVERLPVQDFLRFYRSIRIGA
jgi:hypothetical protein